MIFSVPMAGRGQRFRDAGYTTPKPLIEVHGRPMYSHAVDSLPLALATRLVFICLGDQLDDGLDADIAERYGDRFDTRVVRLAEVTAGQAATVVAGAEHYDDDVDLVIYNADTVSVGDQSALGTLDADVVGALGVFRAEGDHWSFARTDDRGRVVETAEKVRISPWASTGLYHFRRAGDFLRIAHDAATAGDRSQGELYVAPLYNRLIDEGGRVEIVTVDDVVVLGTPAELDANLHRLA